MAEFKCIPITDIAVPDRLRPLEEEHAIAIAQSMVVEGQLQPILVRATPAAKAGKFTLVAGRHRLRAVELNQWIEIDAVIVKADQHEAMLMEISENLFRNDLSVMDRALFVATYREVWQEKHGAIKRGPRGNKDQVDPNSPMCVVDLIAAEAEAGFAQHVADRLGISKPAAKRLDRISRHLTSAMREQVRGTAIADNQAALLKLAQMEPDRQRRMALALRESGSDLKKAVVLVDGAKPKPSRDEIAFGGLVTAWSRANSAVRGRFMAEFGLEMVGDKA